MSHPTDFIDPNNAGRFDIYRSVHKGLRAFMADTLTRVGRTDPADAQECEDTAAQLRALLHVCSEHLAHENRFLHTAMERRAPGSAGRCMQEHVQHEAHISALGACLQVALNASHGESAAAWQRLYQELSLFVADNFVHMTRSPPRSLHGALHDAAID